MKTKLPNSHISAVLVLIIILLGHAGPVAGTTYKYVDENGVICFTDDPATIPEALQDRVETKGFSAPKSAEPSPSNASRRSQPIDPIVFTPQSSSRSKDLIHYRYDDRLDLAANLLGYDMEVYPQLFGEKIDKTGALGQLEAIARDIKKDMKKWSRNDAKTLIGCMLDRITHLGFSYQSVKLEERIVSLPDILKSKRPNCFGFSLLCLALGERLGLPLYAVGIPCPNVGEFHMFIRYDDGQERFNLEATNRWRGLRYGDSKYVRKWGAWKSPYFFKNLSKQEIVGDYLYYLYYLSERLKNWKLADECAKKGRELAPESWWTNYMMALTSLRQGNTQQARKCAQKMLEVGYMAPPELLEQLDIEYPNNRWVK
ncbi:MAG: DUF4124 domain-containing protein [Thermodesulfobacteriota bacterium]|nr:DUF4124 domain-containing protein [Thermodesulfobacteriota bacterium]